MGRKSTVKRLPPKVREKIAALNDQGATIDEILAHLDKLGAEVSRSALGRHVKGLNEVAQEIQQSRLVAEAIAKEFGAEDQDRVADANLEMMHTVMRRLMFSEDGIVQLGPQEAELTTRALKNLAQTRKANTETVAKIREEERRRAREEIHAEAAAKARSAAGRQGLSAAGAQAFVAEVFGDGAGAPGGEA